jgi:TRAP-type mannitol/chloroaromatic compound transport system permease small subunit
MLQEILKRIDTLSEWAGRIVGWVMVPLVAITVLEVVLRYVFNSPTVWAWEVNRMLLGAITVMGISYALLHGSHVAVDIVVTKISDRKRMWLSIVTKPIIIFSLGLLLWRLVPYSWVSVTHLETLGGAWRAPIYPLKALMVVGFVLLSLQALVLWTRDLVKLAQGNGVDN